MHARKAALALATYMRLAAVATPACSDFSTTDCTTCVRQESEHSGRPCEWNADTQGCSPCYVRCDRSTQCEPPDEDGCDAPAASADCASCTQQQSGTLGRPCEWDAEFRQRSACYVHCDTGNQCGPEAARGGSGSNALQFGPVGAGGAMGAAVSGGAGYGFSDATLRSNATLKLSLLGVALGAAVDVYAPACHAESAQVTLQVKVWLPDALFQAFKGVLKLAAMAPGVPSFSVANPLTISLTRRGADALSFSLLGRAVGAGGAALSPVGAATAGAAGLADTLLAAELLPFEYLGVDVGVELGDLAVTPSGASFSLGLSVV